MRVQVLFVVLAAACGGTSSRRSGDHRDGNGGEAGGTTAGAGGRASGVGGARSGAGGRGGSSGTSSGTGATGEGGAEGGASASGGEPQGGAGDGGACSGGLVRCGDDCVDTKTSTLHCGVCNHPCTSGDGTTPFCVDGACPPHQCPTGYADCETDILDCETDLSTPENCGRCGGRCEAEQTCESGRCV